MTSPSTSPEEGGHWIWDDQHGQVWCDDPAHRPTAQDGEGLARLFHEAYERLAPEYGYKTREASAVPWEKVPENNKRLMIATVAAVAPDIASAAVTRCAQDLLDWAATIERGNVYDDDLRASMARELRSLAESWTKEKGSADE
jgi:hypothetical protein